VIGRFFRGRSKAPLGLAGLLSITLFFAGLMASSLAIDKPRVLHRLRHGKVVLHYEQSSSATEAKIWLLALVPPLLLVAVGWFAAHFPYALYVTCAAACVDALALTIRLHRWELHHTARFAYGEDLLADQTTSSSLARGEWEHDAAQTVWSLVHYTIGLSIAAVLITAFLTVRRRRGKPVAPPPPPLELVTGGAPPTSV